MIRSRLFPIMIKEFIHILRDPRSLGIVFVMPVMMVFLFGYAIDMDLKNVRLGVCDLSRSPASRDLVEKLEASTYFRIVSRLIPAALRICSRNVLFGLSSLSTGSSPGS